MILIPLRELEEFVLELFGSWVLSDTLDSFRTGKKTVGALSSLCNIYIDRAGFSFVFFGRLNNTNDLGNHKLLVFVIPS